MTQGDRQVLTRDKRSYGARSLAPEHNGRVHPHGDCNADLNTISRCSFPWLSQCTRLPYMSGDNPSCLHMHGGGPHVHCGSAGGRANKLPAFPSSVLNAEGHLQWQWDSKGISLILFPQGRVYWRERYSSHQQGELLSQSGALVKWRDFGNKPTGAGKHG